MDVNHKPQLTPWHIVSFALNTFLSEVLADTLLVETDILFIA